MNEPHLNVFWAKQGQVHSNSVEEVSGRESGGNSLEDNWVSRHSKQLKENTVEETIIINICKPVHKNREAGTPFIKD